MLIKVFVKPVPEDASSRAKAAYLYALATPSFFSGTQKLGQYVAYS